MSAGGGQRHARLTGRTDPGAGPHGPVAPTSAYGAGRRRGERGRGLRLPGTRRKVGRRTTNRTRSVAPGRWFDWRGAGIVLATALRRTRSGPIAFIAAMAATILLLTSCTPEV